MKASGRKPARQPCARGGHGATPAVDEVTVDCYNMDDRLAGLLTMLEDDLALLTPPPDRRRPMVRRASTRTGMGTNAAHGLSRSGGG